MSLVQLSCLKEIRRLKYPEEITPELFEEFAAKSEPVIIEGQAARRFSAGFAGFAV